MWVTPGRYAPDETNYGAYADCYPYQHAQANADQHSRTKSHAYLNAYSYRNVYEFAHCYADCHSNADSDANAFPYKHLNSNAYANRNQGAATGHLSHPRSCSLSGR